MFRNLLWLMKKVFLWITCLIRTWEASFESGNIPCAGLLTMYDINSGDFAAFIISG